MVFLSVFAFFYEPVECTLVSSIKAFGEIIDVWFFWSGQSVFLHSDVNITVRPHPVIAFIAAPPVNFQIIQV